MAKLKGVRNILEPARPFRTLPQTVRRLVQKIAPPFLINEILHLTVYPVAFPQLFKHRAHTFTEIVFLIVHEGFKVWKQITVK